MLSFLKRIFLFVNKIYYSGFNRKILNGINKNEDVFLEILQFSRRSRRFVSKVFASEESLNCFKLFLGGHKKNEEMYSRDNIKNIFIDPNFSEDQTNLIKLLLDNDIPIYGSDPEKFSIKNILRISIKKQDQPFFETLLFLYKENKITLSSIQKTFSIPNVLDRIRKHGNLKEIEENLKFKKNLKIEKNSKFIDFLSTCSVNNENINEIFSDNNTAFGKMKDESNRELLKLLLQHQITYSIDKIKYIFSFEKNIFNKIKDNPKLTEYFLKYKFDISNMKDLFSMEDSSFKVVKENPEQIIKYVSDHGLNFTDIKKIDVDENGLSIELIVPISQLSNPSVEGLKKQKISK